MNPLDHYKVIKAIDSASSKELRAIARVESAVRDSLAPGQVIAPKPLDVRRNRREKASSDFSPATEPTVEQQTIAVTVEPKAISPVATETVDEEDEATALLHQQVAVSKKTNQLLQGLWKDSKGVLRQQSGAFATRQQKEAAAGTTEQNTENDSLPAKVLSWIGEKLEGSDKNEAVDAAGVATAGSEFMAAKEIYNLTKEAKQLLQDKGLNSKEGIKSNIKNLASKVVSPSKWFSSEQSDKKVTLTSPGGSEQSASPQTTTEPEKQPKPSGRIKSVLSNIANPFKLFGAKAAGSGSDPLKANDISAQSSGPFKQVSTQQQNSAPAQAVGKALQDRKSDLLSETITEAITEQTGSLGSKLDKLEDAIKDMKVGAGGGGGSLLDSALDLFGDRKSKRRGRGTARTTRSTARVGSRAGSLIGMGAGSAATAGAAGAAGAGAKTGIGAIAKAGGALLSKLALPLTAALAVYDGVSGFNDKEKQKEAFNLKEGQEATTGQKSAMAAGSVLSLGGLTELIGISDKDIAKSVYGLFGGDTEEAEESAVTDKPGENEKEKPATTPEESEAKSSAQSAPTSSVAPASASVEQPAPLALTSASAPPVQSSMMIGASAGAGASVGSSVSAAQLSEPAIPAASPPVPSMPNEKGGNGGNQGSITVVAQSDPKLMRAIESLAKGQQPPVEAKSKETMKSQTPQTTSQIPTGLSNETMRMIAMDLL